MPSSKKHTKKISLFLSCISLSDEGYLFVLVTKNKEIESAKTETETMESEQKERWSSSIKD